MDRVVPEGEGKSEARSIEVARKLLTAIQEGVFPVGERLPSEQALADQFQVSRPSLREALSALQFAGYVASRQGYGTVVIKAADEPASAFDLGNAEALGSDPVPLFEARLIVEPEVVRMAASEPSPALLAEARHILDGMWLALDAATDLGIDSDVNLHLVIVRMCPNPALRSIEVALLAGTNPSQWRNVRTEVWSKTEVLEEWAIQHEALLSALQAGDGERAARSARRHLMTTLTSLIHRRSVSATDKQRLQAIYDRQVRMRS